MEGKEEWQWKSAKDIKKSLPGKRKEIRTDERRRGELVATDLKYTKANGH